MNTSVSPLSIVEREANWEAPERTEDFERNNQWAYWFVAEGQYRGFDSNALIEPAVEPALANNEARDIAASHTYSVDGEYGCRN